jgi:molybdopterin-containing oxidoreductase family membrane subunit
MLATGLVVAYGYMSETFIAWYSGDTYEQFMTINRMIGPYAVLYWGLITCNILIPQLLWLRKIRVNVAALFAIAMAVNIGMWLERFVIVVVSLHRDFMPSAWGMYYPTRWDWFTFFGTVGLFLTLLLLFIRFLPLISIFEMRELVGSAASRRAEGEAD